MDSQVSSCNVKHPLETISREEGSLTVKEDEEVVMSKCNKQDSYVVKSEEKGSVRSISGWNDRSFDSTFRSLIEV